jgi:hypothetical protein
MCFTLRLHMPAAPPQGGLTPALDIGMSSAWNLEALRAHIRGLGCDEMPLLEVVDSIDRATLIFRYHLFTARDALKGIVDESDPAGLKNMALVFGTSEQQKEYSYAKLVSEANIIGCIHAVRSIFDIFSHLVNRLILSKPIPLYLCDIGKVHEAMPQSELKDQLGQLLRSDWFNYVSGFINTTKHRKLVLHGFSVSFEENIAGVRVGAFEYKGKTYPAYWGTEVLQGVVEVKNTVIACGRTLNRLCTTTNV